MSGPTLRVLHLALCFAGCSLVAACNHKSNEPAPLAKQGPAEKTFTLSIVSTNDVHGHLDQLPLFGGYLHNLRAARDKDHGAVLLLDAGDIFQGTLESNLSEGAAMVHAYNALGYNAVTIGNHEFDFGPVGPESTPLKPDDDPLGALRARIAESKFPWVNSNLHGEKHAKFPIKQVHAGVIQEVNGIKIGIVGAITHDALSATAVPNTVGLGVGLLAKSVQLTARKLRKKGATIVIALVHAGGECKNLEDSSDISSCDEHGEVFELARKLKPGDVDLIIGGHTHAAIAQVANNIPIIEAYSNGRAFGRVDLQVQPSDGKVASHQIHTPQALCDEDLDKEICTKASYEGAPVAREEAVLKAISGDRDAARAQSEKPLNVTLAAEIKRASDVESPLGNLVADVMKQALPPADAAINNAGALRTSLPAGPLTYGRLFEMMPFDNSLAVLKIDAAALAQIIHHSLLSGHGILALAGLHARATCDGADLKVEILRGNAVLPPTTKLRVITSDYLAAHGEDLLRDAGLTEDQIEVHRDKPMRDAIIAGLQAMAKAGHGTIPAEPKGLYDAKSLRIDFPGKRPVKCEGGTTPADATATTPAKADDKKPADAKPADAKSTVMIDKKPAAAKPADKPTKPAP